MTDLDALPIFQNLTSNGKQLFKQGLVRKKIEPSTKILHKGSKVSGAYIVINGRLRVFSISPSGSEATLYCINPGETCVLAINCLFQDLLYPAWVEAERASDVAIIPGPLYRGLFKQESSFQDLTIHALSTAVFRLMQELEQVHFYKLEHRLANMILLRASSDGVLRMTHQELAFQLGTAREVVSRLMKSLVEKRFVESKRGMVIIKNAAAMADLISSDNNLADTISS